MNEVILCWSNLSQLKINIKTTEFIIKNKRVPVPNEIDESVRLANISAKRFITLKETYNPIELSEYKLFFTNLFNSRYIRKRFYGDGISFDDNNNTLISPILDDKFINIKSKLLTGKILQVLSLETNKENMNITNKYMAIKKDFNAYNDISIENNKDYKNIIEKWNKLID
jgi:hypothetical protein